MDSAPQPAPVAATPPFTPPTLGALFFCFLAIGMQSFGGGLSGWIRREVVQQRGWVDDQQFLSGLALCQIAPGANAVNLAVFIGGTLRGWKGATAALGGMVGLPVILVLIAGAFYASLRTLPWLEALLAGMGAAAIGLTLAMAWRLMRRNVRGAAGWAVMLTTTLSVGVLRWPLLPVLAVMVPVSLALEWARRR